MMRRRDHHDGDVDRAKFWDQRAQEFNRHTLEHRGRTEEQIERMGLLPTDSVLDIGAGTGRLALPIARRVAKVTAIDQSGGMLGCLKGNMAREGIDNIECIQKPWEDIEIGVDIEPHDVVIASHSLGMHDIGGAVTKMDQAAKRQVYLFTFAGGWMQDGEEELWHRIRGRGQRGHRHSDYMLLYNILHDNLEIYADVNITRREWQQSYVDLDEAVSKWKEMHDLSADKEEVLRGYLEKVLRPDQQGRLAYSRRSKEAMISWSKGTNGGVAAVPGAPFGKREA